MSCEEKTMTEDLMQLLTTEITFNEFENPNAVSHYISCMADIDCP